eukprot:115094_1
MTRRTRMKPTNTIRPLANVSESSPQNNISNPESQCCSTINGFIASIMKHFVIPSFAFNLIGCIVTSYYFNLYLETNWLYHLQGLQTMFSASTITLCASLLSHGCALLCTLFVVVFYSYLYLVIAIRFSPMGDDVHSYSIGRSKYHPSRVYAFIYTCFQSFHTLSYFNSYFFRISSYLSNIKRISLDADLSKMDYASYTLGSFKRIVSFANNRVLEAIEKQQREQRSYLKQAHYDEIVKQNTNDVLQCAQSKPQHMVSILNVRYDKDDQDQYAHIFVPPSTTTNGYNDAPTPAIIFLVGGAWGSCDITFSASAASSFVNAKIAFIYPTYRVYPNGDVQDMLRNIYALMDWITAYASALNINPNHLAIVGQSSGAHLGALSVLKAYQQKLPWLQRVRLFCGLAGPYCIKDHYTWESSRGIENLSPMGRAMKGVHNFVFYSPSGVAQELHTLLRANKYPLDNAALPHFLLIHSVNDYVVPISSTRKFAHLLKQINAECESKEYKHGTHYDSLFGLCDMKNCLFHPLSTDICSRLFVCCKRYNERHAFTSSVSSLHMATAQEQNAPDMEDVEDAFYNETSEELIHSKARTVHGTQQIVSNVSGDGDKTRSDRPAMDDLPVANSLVTKEGRTLDDTQRIESYVDTEQRRTEIEEFGEWKEEMMDEEEQLIVQETDKWSDDEAIDMNLFKYGDVSQDPDKSDEVIELLRHLSLDMDKALDAVLSFNKATLQ